MCDVAISTYTMLLALMTVGSAKYRETSVVGKTLT